ncbi:hypothetical protein ACROYT_G024299 [Oculina patagonica]
MQIEKNKDKEAATHTFEELQRQWAKEYNLSKENITKMIQDYDNVRENGVKPAWSFLNAVYYVLQLVTTIGYGNITPQTSSGQLFTIAYAIVGIPLTVLALKSIGELVNMALRTVNRPIHIKFHTIQCDEGSCDFLEKGNLLINSSCLIVTWIVASAASAHLEPKRSLIDNVYSIFVTYSTVGFGDIIPFKDQIYVFMITVLPGLSFMSSLIDSIVAYVEKTSIMNEHCFSLTKCRPKKGEARITTDGAQQDLQNNNEHAV